MATAELDIPGYPFFLQEDPASPNPIYYSAQDFRNYTAALQRRPGILGLGDFHLTQADNIGFKVKVHYGYIVVGGYYIAYLPNDTEMALPWTTPTTGTVTHKAFVAIYDELVTGSINKATVVITQDTGAGAPNPTGAAAYLQTATISVSSTQSNIQNSHIKNIVQHAGGGGAYLPLAFYLKSNLTPAGTVGGPADFRAMYHDGFIRLSGRVAKVDGTNFTSDVEVPIGTMHPNLSPKYAVYLTGVTNVSTGNKSGTMTFRLTILPDGTMTARIPDTQTVKFLTFDGLTYDLD